ncbi:PSP1 domain-containing protein [Culicoidibacter larvae]|uniref:Stage 0 sporulation family protein n=1 Tax=Culicoidibacter larvae TaxID=2579976 RepID=A0A5R8QGU6_9FIRM|nr:stage 0 sporulation family protein [Culicoidibacter larvae]TLG77202.1 stage 0 sporulation family protein [Culicoidibacter larvae]
MVEVVGIRFKTTGKVYYFDPNKLSIEQEMHVIADTSRGLECGQVVQSIKKVNKDEVVLPLKKVVRIATEKDHKKIVENQKAADKAIPKCTELIRKNKLDMQLLDAEYTHDRERLLFSYTAGERVDFRQLLKDLAGEFKTRIELRQVGVRDKARIVGGLGPCGYALCCSTFSGDFDGISIKMAKNQNLSLNPIKISGLCGRLLCCLQYENEVYVELNKMLPDVGSFVKTDEGEGRIQYINVLKQLLTVVIKNDDTTIIREYHLDDVEVLKHRKKK